jgi:U3 small nucleolar RNA-associated protein 20
MSSWLILLCGCFFLQQSQSYFNDVLLKWRDQDLTTQFQTVARELRPFVHSLPQILHHRDEIIEILLRHLQVEKSSARVAILELLSTLARDLRMEYYPVFPRVLRAVAMLLDPRDVQVVEASFVCIGFLFKFLLRQLLGDLPNVFSCVMRCFQTDLRPR